MGCKVSFVKTDLTLYTFFRSSTAWRVRIVLNHKMLGVDFKFIKLSAGEQKSEEYGKVNPNQAVPALVLGNGQILIESMAICQYLEETYTQKPLLPKDKVKKAQVRGFCEVVNSAIHPYQNQRLLQRLAADGIDKVKFAEEWVLKGMVTLEKLLQKTRGKYCFGDEVTLADAFFYPHALGGVARFKVNIDDFPNCKVVLRNLQQLQAFQQSEPKLQPDYEA